MRNANMGLNFRVVFVAVMLMGVTAVAQTQPTQPSSRQTPAMQEAPAERPTAAELLPAAGGSLLRASQAAQGIDPNRPRLASVSLFTVPEPEPKVMRKHDLVTIIIREESEFSSEGTTETKKEADIDARLEEWFRLKLGGGNGIGLGSSSLNADPPSVRASGARNFKGEGTVEREDRFIARIQGEVVDVKPNGTFVVQARKRIKTDEEEQEFILTGIARAADVTPDNSVLSTQVYNLELTKNHKGNVRNAGKKGLIPKAIDFINPF